MIGKIKYLFILKKKDELFLETRMLKGQLLFPLSVPSLPAESLAINHLMSPTKTDGVKKDMETIGQPGG